jgi:polysaccharide biosynthesis/export protein
MHNLIVRLQAAAAALVLSMSLGGCAQNHFSAAKLPAEMLAPPIENMEAIDLSGLSHYATNSELIDRGDVLEVTVVTNYSTLATTTTPVRVTDDGTVDVPLIGPVPVAGLESEAAEQAIAAAAISRGIFQKPHITVTMKRQRSNRVTVIGGVKQPGVYSLARGSSSLLASLVAAGGLAEDAGPDVEIRHALPAVPAPRPGAAPPMPEPPGPEMTPSLATPPAGPPPAASPASPLVHVNLAKAATEGDSRYPVQDGDVVIVGKRAPKPIYVLGLVHKPGEYRLPNNQNMQVLDALALAGERTLQVADKVLVIRRVPGRPEPVVIEVSVREAKQNGNANLRLAAGDIVSVEETPATIVVRTFTDIVRFTVGGMVPMF